MAHRYSPTGRGSHVGGGAESSPSDGSPPSSTSMSVRNQPLALGPWRLVMNGEIYNYVELRGELRGYGREFTTEGDAEILLHAWDEWGESALDSGERHVRVRDLA